MALNYSAHHWKMNIDGKDISGRYILWGAMNARSAGPALNLAPKAATDDGRLDFVVVREDEREIFVKCVDAHLAERKARVPLTPRKFRELKIASVPGAMHLDGKRWPSKKTRNRRQHVAAEITIRPAALIICKPVLKSARLR